MLKGHDLVKTYGSGTSQTRALNGVSFNIDEGEFVSITGPSGSGKSTLMYIMGFLEIPTSGDYTFRNKRIDDLKEQELADIRNKQMGFIFQTFNLLAGMDVLHNVELPLIYANEKPKNRIAKAKQAIDAVGLTPRINHFPNELSGGEKQRVAIARAIINEPAVIFADEPTGNLDTQSGQKVMQLLQDLNERGHTIILVTHEKYTSEMAQRKIELLDGKVINDAPINNRHFAKDGLIK